MRDISGTETRIIIPFSPSLVRPPKLFHICENWKRGVYSLSPSDFNMMVQMRKEISSWRCSLRNKSNLDTASRTEVDHARCDVRP